MRIVSWNILNGGADPASGRARWRGQAELLAELAPDVLLLQEARGFDADGAAGLFQAEADLGMRGLLGLAPHTGQHTAVFLRAGLRPVRWEVDVVHFHHALTQVQVLVPGLAEPLQVASMHLSPLSPALRAAEVGWLAGLAAPGVLAVLGGDANSLAPGDPEPADWPALPAHQRVRYLDLAAGSPRADRSAVAFLHAAGLVDAAYTAADADAATGAGGTVDATGTVPTRGYPDAEFVAFRSDHLLLSPALAAARTGYQVVQDQRAHASSDHLPVLVDLDLSRLQATAAPTGPAA